MGILFMAVAGDPITSVVEGKGHGLQEMTDLYWNLSSTTSRVWPRPVI